MLLSKLINWFKFFIYKKAISYIKSYEEFSYNIKKNGELNLINSLSKLNFKIIFDVGANLGEWTKITSDKFQNSNFHLFEISETSFATLNDNFLRNENINLNNLGLYNEEKEIEYQDYGKYSAINSLILDSTFHNEGNIPIIKKCKTTSGDKYCEIKNIDTIDFLKIDAQGVEYQILDGFKKKLKEAKIKVIQFEYGYINANSKFLMNDFYKLLCSYGYVLGPLKKNGVIFMEFDYSLNNFNSGPNFIAVHKSYKEIIDLIKGNQIKGYPYLNK